MDFPVIQLATGDYTHFGSRDNELAVTLVDCRPVGLSLCFIIFTKRFFEEV